MNDTGPLEFEQIADSRVYETRVEGSAGWSGYLLPASDALPGEIPLSRSLDDFPGHYLFSVRRPALLDTDPKAFAQAVLEHIRKKASTNRVALWLSAIEPLDFGAFNEFGFSFGPNGTGTGYELQSNMGAQIDPEVSFFVLEQSALRIDADVPGLRISANDTPGAPFIGFERNGKNMGISVTGGNGFIRARVPVGGTNSGCFVFTATMTPAVTFCDRALGPGFRYVVNDRSRGQMKMIDYRAYPVDQMPSQLALVGTLDPSDPDNSACAAANLASGHLRSGFTIAGSPSLTSYSLTPQGKTVVLTPLGTGSDHVVPPLLAGGFSWASPSPVTGKPGQGPAYLAPTGLHGIAILGLDAGQPGELLCGLFGSERLTFRTYDAGVPAGNNDLLFFLASQAGYAPVFPFDVADLEQPDPLRQDSCHPA